MRLKQIIAVLSSTALLLCGCSTTSAKDRTYTDTLYDTVIKVQVLDPVDKDVMSGLKTLCKKYDTMFSMYVEGSDIYNINHAGGAPVSVSQDTATLIQKGIYYSGLSNGSFDIMIGAVSQLWDFTSGNGTVPDEAAIAAALTHVNYKNITVSGTTVQLSDPEAAIDVGAIAKGYIADRVKSYLKDNGVKHAVIDLGGNVLLIGSKTDGSKYNIGIQKPFSETGEPITSIKVADKSVVTTGIYQRYFEANGKIYHHILDPHTGYPCENTLYSDTIITNSSLTADALSTTCYLMGYEAANKLVDQLDNVDAVFITNDNEIHYTKNFLK